MGNIIGLPLPQIIDPAKNPFNFVFIQLILSIPIFIAGIRFYTVGFSRLIQRHPNMDSLIAIGTAAAYIYGIYGILKSLLVIQALLKSHILRQQE